MFNYRLNKYCVCSECGKKVLSREGCYIDIDLPTKRFICNECCNEMNKKYLAEKELSK